MFDEEDEDLPPYSIVQKTKIGKKKKHDTLVRDLLDARYSEQEALDQLEII